MTVIERRQQPIKILQMISNANRVDGGRDQIAPELTEKKSFLKLEYRHVTRKGSACHVT